LFVADSFPILLFMSNLNKTSKPWEELRVIRQKDGHSKASLARATGYTPQYVSALELGSRKPTPAVIHKFALVLNVPKSVIEPHTTDGVLSPEAGDAA
jgi:transcriptional regulator with XRE-family HTH domain